MVQVLNHQFEARNHFIIMFTTNETDVNQRPIQKRLNLVLSLGKSGIDPRLFLNLPS